MPIIVPIMMLAIKEAASDMSPYVRKTAAHAIPKLYRYVPNLALHSSGGGPKPPTHPPPPGSPKSCKLPFFSCTSDGLKRFGELLEMEDSAGGSHTSTRKVGVGLVSTV